MTGEAGRLEEAATIDRHLSVQAGRRPDAPALVYYGRSMSYAELDRAVDRLAGFLQQRLGLQPGQRVLLVMQNSPQYVIGYYAVLRAGGVVVPGNPMNRRAELAHYLADSGARLALVGEDLLEELAPLVGEGLLEAFVVARYADYAEPGYDIALPEALAAPAKPLPAGGIAWAEALAADLAPGSRRAGVDDLAVIPYSSGTTGQPKGCMHTHRTVMATVLAGIAWNPVPEGPAVHLVSLPLFHVTGMQSSMNTPLYLGQTMVVMSRWDRRTAARLIERYRVSRWRNISTMAIDLLGDPELERYDLSSLEGIGGGGAAMPDAVFDRLKARTGIAYIEGYGLTETMAATHINPPGAPRRRCLGLPIRDVTSFIRDPESGRLLGPNQPGEIVINAPQVFKGYWNNPEATAAAFVEIESRPFFRTGDIGLVDEEGFYYMVDRVKRMINLAGFKVWPAEVELLLHRHPGLSEACVIAAADPRRGETVKALVVPRQGQPAPTPEEIQDWCRREMSAYKVPRIIEIVDHLPRSATGKVDWRLLQERERHG